MKKLKPIFYALYITYFLVCAFVAITHEQLVLYWKWDFIDTWVALMRLVLKLGGIGTILFAVALIIEKLHIKELNKKIAQQEKKLAERKSNSNR